MSLLVLRDPRVLVCGSRSWRWPGTVTAVLDRLAARHGDRLVVIEGAATGADSAAHRWCEAHALSTRQHRCYPVDWVAMRHSRPDDWRLAGPERNTLMLIDERPRLIVAFQDRFDPAAGGTFDMCLRGLLAGVPVWLVTAANPQVGRWLSQDEFPSNRTNRIRRELRLEPPTPPGLFDLPPA